VPDIYLKAPESLTMPAFVFINHQFLTVGLQSANKKEHCI